MPHRTPTSNKTARALSSLHRLLLLVAVAVAVSSFHPRTSTRSHIGTTSTDITHILEQRPNWTVPPPKHSHRRRRSLLHQARFKDIRHQEKLRQLQGKRRYWISSHLRKWRQRIRFVFQKYTIYVLACENGNFYVGSTQHKRQRLRQHMDGPKGGSAWTRMHKPVKVVEIIKRVPAKYYLGMEAQVTAQYMYEYGVNKVRGAYFSETRKYDMKDIEALTGFLGHYNDLDFEDVRSHLEATLPEAPPTTTQESSSSAATASTTSSRKNSRNSNTTPTNNNNNNISSQNKRNARRRIQRRLQRQQKRLEKEQQQQQAIMEGETGHSTWDGPSNNNNNNNTESQQRTVANADDDKCYNCGEIGHYSWECPKKRRNPALDRSADVCYACGEIGHHSWECPN